MKTNLFITFLLCFSTFSCTKEKIVDNTDYVKTPTELIGSWNWLETSGGIASAKYNSSTTGESIKIELDSLNSIRYISNGSLKYETKFHVVKTASFFHHGDSILILTIDPYPHYMDVVKQYSEFISNCYFSFNSTDTLVFTEAAFDGFNHYYIKTK
jgi:hypothetical protein